MKEWTPERLKKACIAPREARYQALATNKQIEGVLAEHPEIFQFNAISIGDEKGQAFIVPLDESSRETAEYILRAIAAYEGD